MMSPFTDCLTSWDLPSDLYEEGEVKPTRSQKKKAANGTAKKRPATEVCDLPSRQRRCAVWDESFLT